MYMHTVTYSKNLIQIRIQSKLFTAENFVVVFEEFGAIEKEIFFP